MPGRPPKAQEGDSVANAPGGFPLFYERRKPRVVTADPWAFLSHLAVRLGKRNEDIANAYIAQGYDFFEAAQTPRLHSRPLLYYYAFLNVVKAALLIRQVALPPLARHGISDPRANSRIRLRLAGQGVQIQNAANDRSEIFPEFLSLLGYKAALPKFFRVIDLLEVVPSIHRTFTQVMASPPIFAPIERFEIRYRRGSVWVLMRVVRADKDVRDALPRTRSRRAFTSVFSQVESEHDDELWFETAPVRAQTRGIDNAIGQLAVLVKRCGTAAILTAQGYRFYLVNTPPSAFVPYLAAMYGVIFYLGSITRYKPDVWDKIISGKESWIVEEFLASLPTQFLYGLASELAGVDVVRPYAAVS